MDLRARDREITIRLHRDLLEEYNTVTVTIIELANNEVMHENTNRLPAHVILENHRMSNRLAAGSQYVRWFHRWTTVLVALYISTPHTG